MRNASASVVADGRAAGIVVLDDHGGRLGELADQVQGAIEIEDVVERQLLAVQHLGGGDAGVRDAGLDVERGLLVRVLAVAAASLLVQAATRCRSSAAGQASAAVPAAAQK